MIGPDILMFLPVAPLRKFKVGGVVWTPDPTSKDWVWGPDSGGGGGGGGGG